MSRGHELVAEADGGSWRRKLLAVEEEENETGGVTRYVMVNNEGMVHLACAILCGIR